MSLAPLLSPGPSAPAPRFGGEQQYLDLLAEALRDGERREDRTGVGTLGLFGRSLRFDLADGFPLLTTKRVHFASIVTELLWFLQGRTDVAWLNARGCTIWDEWADEDGELGPVYGKQWRSWAAPDGRVIDQISLLLAALKANPHSRRHVVSAWNPADVEAMALPPCHCLFQFHVSQDPTDPARSRLNCQLYQRSADLFLGVPFNIASYALLTQMVAAVTGLLPGEFIHILGDAHLYVNHTQQAAAQLTRAPRPWPRVRLAAKSNLFAFTPEDIALEDYRPYPGIKAPIAV